jgi:hypothetical protein
MKYIVYIPKNHLTQNALLCDLDHRIYYVWDVQKTVDYTPQNNLFKLVNARCVVTSTIEELSRFWNKTEIFDNLEDFREWFMEKYMEFLL